MVRGSRVAAALGRTNAASALLALLDAHPSSLGFVDLARGMGGNKDSGGVMAAHLEGFGLVTITEKEGVAGRPAYEVSLTATGRKLAEIIGKATDILPDEEETPVRRRRA